MIKGAFNIVIGAQAGSESKGKLAAFLADKFKPDIICMAASPNAGHSVIINGQKFVTYHLPVSWVAHRSAKVMLGPTSVIHWETLNKELGLIGISPHQLFIHPRAVIIRDHYMWEEREKGLLKIGSTNQGVGVARREKLMRVEDITFASSFRELRPYVDDTVFFMNDALRNGETVLCEMTQGADLCLEHGIHPRFVTSKMIHPSMAMAEQGVSPKWIGHTYGVLRPYPIRVNNREGSSGPYADAAEIDWKTVGERSKHPNPESIAELTTTTKLLRRVFEFSVDRFNHFCLTCQPDVLCLQFANYLDHQAFGEKQYSKLPKAVKDFVSKLQMMSGVAVNYIGTGPDHHEMIDRGIDLLKPKQAENME